MFSPVNPLRAYSGVKYLCDALAQRGIELELWANIPRDMMHETIGWRFSVRSFLNMWYGAIPKFRVLATKCHILWMGLFTHTAILYVDHAFLREIVLIKWLRPKKTLIHYCPEFYKPGEVKSPPKGVVYYQSCADIANIVIDVEPNRAKLRKEYYNLSKLPLVIPNTLPRSEIPPFASAGTLAELAGGPLPEGVPVLLYTGAILNSIGDGTFNTILRAVSMTKRSVFFLAFVYGDVLSISAVRQACLCILDSGKARICNSVPRRQLLACIHEADAGIVYYPPGKDIGCCYCAPTKIFEYFAAGLPVVSAPNPSLVELIGDKLGVCAKEDTPESLALAIEQCLDLFANPQRKQLIREEFNNNLCYEVAAFNGLTVLDDILKDRADISHKHLML